MYWLKDYLCLSQPSKSIVIQYHLLRSLTKNENVDEKIEKLRQCIEDSCKEFSKENVLLSICNPIITEIFWIYSTDVCGFDNEYYASFYNRLMQGYDYFPFSFWMALARLYITRSSLQFDVDMEVLDHLYEQCTTDFNTYKYTKIVALYYIFEQMSKFGVLSLRDEYLQFLDKLTDFLEEHEEDVLWAEGCQQNTNGEKYPHFLAF